MQQIVLHHVIIYIAITSKPKHIKIRLKYIKHLFQIIIFNDGTYNTLIVFHRKLRN